jgi:hypothetical protein
MTQYTASEFETWFKSAKQIAKYQYFTAATLLAVGTTIQQVDF